MEVALRVSRFQEAPMSSPGKTLTSSYLVLSAFMLGFGVPSWATWVVCLSLGLLCGFLSPGAFDFYNL